jgi:hypothetical protein
VVLVALGFVLARPVRAGPDEDLAVELAACEAKDSSACMQAAGTMDRLHIASRLGHSSDELRRRAYGELEHRCDAQDAEACLSYGTLLARTGAPVDTRRAADLIGRACALGNGAGCLHLAYQARAPRALALFEQACAHDSGEGCEQVAVRVARTDPARARLLHRRACDGNYGPGCVHAAEAHRAAGERDAAFADFRHACDLEQSPACDAAGQLAPDPATARGLFQRACDAGIAGGCAHVADLVAHGDGGPRDFGGGVDLAVHACELAHDGRCAHAAALRAHPPEVHCTTVEACKPLCGERIPLACRALGDLYAADPTSDADLAAGPYDTGCTAGDAPSCVHAGDDATDFAVARVAYARACSLAHDATACLYVAYGRALDGAPTGRARLAQRCAGRDLLACTLDGLAEIDRAPARATQRWRTACAAGRADACRLLGEYDETPSFGDCGCDDSLQTPWERREAKLAARRDAERDRALHRACTLGDALGCAELDDGPSPPAGAHADPAWERTNAWWRHGRASR